MRPEILELQESMERQGYVASREIATSVYLAKQMGRPLLVEGDAGVGKTEIARVMAAIWDTELIRLQCYEGLDVNTALYEWDYQRQLLQLKIGESRTTDSEQLEELIFSRKYVLERPLLRAITADVAPVLLIDEIDRADDGFEAFLLEVLSDFQITIPELGTIKATHRPYVFLTSNRTREIGDALRRRCLYLFLEHPDPDKEIRIIKSRVPEASERLAAEIAFFMKELRGRSLARVPGAAESIDWANAMVHLHRDHLDRETVEQTLGCVVKDVHDMRELGPEVIEELLGRVRQELSA